MPFFSTLNQRMAAKKSIIADLGWLRKSAALVMLSALICSLAMAADYHYRITKENIEYRFISSSSKYDIYQDISRVEIIVSKTIIIENATGADHWSKLTLPEPIDPLYYDIISDARNNGFYLDEYRIENLSIRLKHGNKSRNIDVTTPSLDEHKVFLDRSLLYGYVKFSEYNIPNVRIGDELIISYTLSIPYFENKHELESFRIFFHSSVPKENVNIKISKTESARAIFRYVNGAEPHSSFKSEMDIDKWRFDALPSYDEPMSRPYTNLPHIEVICGNQSYGLVNYRFKKMLSNKESVDIGSTYKNFVHLQRFLGQYADSLGTDSHAIAIAALNDIGQFAYDSDSIYFHGDQLFEPKFGEDLTEKRLRESNKYETYAAVLDGLNRYYLILTPIDKRMGQYSNQYGKPVLTGENILAMRTPQKQFMMILPKEGRCGYYVDELPFYFEDINFMIAYQPNFSFNAKDFELTFHTRNQGWNLDRPMLPSAASGSGDNQRHTSVEIIFDEKLEAQINSRIKLTGQYSTICRRIYSCDESHPYVDIQYHQKFGHGVKGIKTITQSITKASTIFPFTTEINLEQSSVTLLLNEAQIHMDLSGIINHIDHNIGVENRELDFYADFKQSDTYVIKVKIPEGYDVATLPPPVSISNSFGVYQLQLQKKDGIIQIFSKFINQNDRVASEQISDAKEIYDAIGNTERLKIELIKD
jgi:hypothetical protein